MRALACAPSSCRGHQGAAGSHSAFHPDLGRLVNATSSRIHGWPEGPFRCDGAKLDCRWMDSQSPIVLLLLVAVIAVIVLVVARRARREPAQASAEDEPKAPALRPARPPATGTGVKVKKIEGGGLWEPWASVPPPRVRPERNPDQTGPGAEPAEVEKPPDAKGTPSDPKAR
jgi:hypothetical protein